MTLRRGVLSVAVSVILIPSHCFACDPSVRGHVEQLEKSDSPFAGTITFDCIDILRDPMKHTKDPSYGVQQTRFVPGQFAKGIMLLAVLHERQSEVDSSLFRIFWRFFNEAFFVKLSPSQFLRGKGA